jgi:YD repeat-containing protein
LLARSYDDLQFTITLNVPWGSTGTYLIDNLRFSGGTSPIPDPPADLVAMPDDGVVQLTWTADSRATSYKVVRSDGQGASAEFSTTKPSYSDSGLANGTTYSYTVAAIGPCGNSAPSVPVSATPSPRTQIILHFPKGVTRDSVVLGANGILRVNDRDKLLDVAGAPMAVSNAGGGETNLGAQSRVGPVTSVASILLRSGGTIQGEVQTAGTFTEQAGAQTSGTPQEHVTLAPFEMFYWSVHIPTTNQVALSPLQPNDDRAITPGAYLQATVNSGAKLRLTAGTYHFTSFDLESGSQLYLDKTAGPITIYVTGAVILRGALVDQGGPEGDFLLVSLGTQDVFVEQVFTGTIVVPNAKLSLATETTPYRGTFFARDIESHQDNVIQALPFGWDRDCVEFGCLAPDMCHLPGVCNPETRLCSNPAKADPSVICDDGNPCTLDHCDPQEGCVHTPKTADGCALSVSPRLACVTFRYIDNVNRVVAVFGYENLNKASVNIPAGSDNSTGGPVEAIYPSIPEWFQAGTVSGAMAVEFEWGQEVTWSLRGATATANANSKGCAADDQGTDTITLPGGETFHTGRGPVDPTTYTDSILPSQSAGAIRGSFAVSDDGAATYRLPLWVPPGLMGVQPQLALSYSSTGGDGFLGRGWQLQGLSQILRCRQDFVREGKRQSIQWTDDDRLCLDGQRLVLTKGKYNQAGAEYRTEHDRFLKIVQVGKDSLGPTGFVVYHPDGTRNGYGYDPTPASAAKDFFGEATAVLDGWAATISVNDGTTDEPIVHYDTQVRYGWALASSADRYANRVQYSYTQQHGSTDSTDVNRWTDFRPASIKYTLNDLTSRVADRQIDFEYTSEDGADARVDTRFSFISGLQLRLGHLVSKIKMSGLASGTPSLVKYYWMQYAPQAARTSALLKTLWECDGNGQCSRPTVFSWSPYSETYERIPTGLDASLPNNAPQTSLPSAGMLLTGDLTGDGRDDLVKGSWWTNPGNRTIVERVLDCVPAIASGTQPPFGGPALGGPVCDFHETGETVALVDLNGDGTTDIFTGGSCPLFCKAGICTGDATSPACSAVLPYVGDFNGDGLVDLIRPMGSGAASVWSYLPNTRDGFATQSVSMNASYSPTDTWNAYVNDYNGDGKAEFIFWNSALTNGNKASTFMHILTDSTSGAVTTSLKASAKSAGSVRYQFADLNGDGLPDAIEIPNAGGDVRIAINTGRGFLPPKAANLSSDFMLGESLSPGDTAGTKPIDPGMRIVDVNLDGRADILYLGDGCPNGRPASALGKIITLAADNDRNGSVSLVPAVSPYSYGVGTVPYDAAMCTGHDASQVLDANGDGLADFIQPEGDDRQLVLYQRQGQPPGLLTNVTDGYGATVDVTYAPMSDPTVYTRIECSYPQTCNQRGRWLVATHTFAKGTLTERALTHTYQGARSDVTGIGWLGMDQHTVVDGDITTTTKYDLDPPENGRDVNTYPKIGRPVERKEEVFEKKVVVNNLVVPTEILTRTSTFDLSGFHTVGFQDEDGHAWWRVVWVSDGVTTEESQDILDIHPPGATHNTRIVRTSGESRTYHPDFGYLTGRSTWKLGELDGSAKEQESWVPQYYPDYDSDEADKGIWLIGRLQRETTHSTVEGVEGVRVTSYERDLKTNALVSTTIEPDSVDPNIYKKTVLTRSPAGTGQVIETAEYVLDPATLTATKARSTKVLAFDSVSGIFPAFTRNALGQVTSQVYHPWLGVLVSETDANGLATRRKYDGFGRLRSESTPDGAVTQVDYSVADQTKPVATATHSVAVTQDGVASTSYYDAVDRLVSVVKVDEKGAPYQTLVQYARSRVYPTSIRRTTRWGVPYCRSSCLGAPRYRAGRGSTTVFGPRRLRVGSGSFQTRRRQQRRTGADGCSAQLKRFPSEERARRWTCRPSSSTVRSGNSA